jgi:glycopeptide antibiotics resistance protein
MTKRRRAVLVAASCVYAVGLWWMTLRPSIYDAEVGGILDRVLEALRRLPATSWVTFDVVESYANVALFVPAGLLAMAWRGRWWHGILIALALSAAIETAQLLWLPSRVADVRDLAANTVGGALGVGLAMMFSRWLRSSQESHNAHHRKLIDSGAQ